jgi:mannan endo-1,4-beta-mannosidase
VVRYWDNLIGLCERHRLRLLVTFWDTFFMSRRWEHHPYGRSDSGFAGPDSFCTSPAAFAAQQARIRFFVDRWGNSPAIFAYDLLNEIHPHWGGNPEEQYRWVTAIAQFMKQYEQATWGKRHLVTVSIFGAHPEEGYRDLIFRHPELDFATTHVYEFGVVDDPDNTIDGAITMRGAVRFALEQMRAVRPYTDSESGPIHAFMDLGRSLPEAFDDEYYHNMSWAHLATGGAGSGMRWPFRDPHNLTPGMHRAQRGMARFVPTLAWPHFAPQPIDEQLAVVARAAPGAAAPEAGLPVVPFGCSDGRQALIWLLRDVRLVAPDGDLPAADLLLSGLAPGAYVAEFWETWEGVKTGELPFTVGAGPEPRTPLPLPALGRDLALAVKPITAQTGIGKESV